MPESTNNRRYLRFDCAEATVSYELHGFPQRSFDESCPLLSLSKGGLGFKTDNALEPGQKLTIVLTCKKAPIRLQARVIHCISHPGTKPRHHVGVQFAPFDEARGGNSMEALNVLDQLERECTD